MKALGFILSFLFSATAAALDVSVERLAVAESEYGPEARLRLEGWNDLMRDARAYPVEARIESVNRFFNQIPYMDDIVHWGTEDYWATPVEMLTTYGADCEDYSIAKYLTLRALGVEDDQLRITYVKAVEYDQAHMVLTYYETPQSDPLILDNLVPEIQPASARVDLKPVYSFNGEGLWLTALQRQDERRIGTSDRLDRWVDLSQRVASMQ